MAREVVTGTVSFLAGAAAIVVWQQWWRRRKSNQNDQSHGTSFAPVVGVCEGGHIGSTGRISCDGLLSC